MVSICSIFFWCFTYNIQAKLKKIEVNLKTYPQKKKKPKKQPSCFPT